MIDEIVVIDYGLSNLTSVRRAFESFGIETKITSNKHDIEKAAGLVLPGVGAFKDGMEGLKSLDLITALDDAVKTGKPLLGICLGMQMLFDESDEFGTHKGLGYIAGRVERIPDIDIEGNKIKVPHINWNGLYPNDGDDFMNYLLTGIVPKEECYFIHSYEAKPKDTEDYVSYVMYGGRKVCAVASHGNVYGTQFHPEKSGKVGLRIIKNYIDIVRNTY